MLELGWAPAVASGMVRCARGAACRRAELVDGVLVGGFIEPGERWHLGHPDGESVGGPEHVRCNTGAPQRLRAESKRDDDAREDGGDGVGLRAAGVLDRLRRAARPGDSGFTVLFDDAPDPDDVPGTRRAPRGSHSCACAACSTTTPSSAVVSTSLASTASLIWTRRRVGRGRPQPTRARLEPAIRRTGWRRASPAIRDPHNFDPDASFTETGTSNPSSVRYASRSSAKRE